MSERNREHDLMISLFCDTTGAAVNFVLCNSLDAEKTYVNANIESELKVINSSILRIKHIIANEIG